MPLTQLGSKVDLPQSPDDAVLERIPVTLKELRGAVVRFSCPEFTSLCPVTGQPDFAKLHIEIIPNHWIIESKSLKLFLGSFRSHGSFHETCTVLIGSRIRDAIEPTWIRVSGLWFPRGGIALDIFWESGNKGNIYVPPLKLYPYEGR